MKLVKLLSVSAVVLGSALFVNADVSAKSILHSVTGDSCTMNCMTGCGPKCKTCFGAHPNSAKAQAKCCGTDALKAKNSDVCPSDDDSGDTSDADADAAAS